MIMKSPLLFALLVVFHVLQGVKAVPTSRNDVIQKLTNVGVEAIRKDLGEGIHKLDEVHNLMSDDERIRITAMQSANQTHQKTLQNLVTEWRIFKTTNTTCVDSLQEIYRRQCIPCIIEKCQADYESYCRPAQRSSSPQGDFTADVRQFFEDNAHAILGAGEGEWFSSNPSDDLEYLLDDLEWLWSQIQRTADDIREFRKDDRQGWVIEITDEFIEFFINELERWLKRERDEIVSSVTDRVDGWFDENIGDDDDDSVPQTILQNVRKTIGSLWDSLTDLIFDNRSEGNESSTEHFGEMENGADVVQADALGFNHEDKLNETHQNVGTVSGWFDDTFGTVFEMVANKTKNQVALVFDGVGDIFGGPFHGRRRRATSHSESVRTSFGEQFLQATCEDLNKGETRGQSCLAFSSKCPDCSLLPETDCAGFVRAKEALLESLVDFRNATAIYKTVFEAFKEGQREYYDGLQSLAKRYRWIANFQKLPQNKRGYRVIKLNYNSSPEEETDDLSPVEVTVVMFGKPPHTFDVEIPVNPLNHDIAGTMIAARALAWYASNGS